MGNYKWVPMQAGATATGNGTAVVVTNEGDGAYTVLAVQVTGINGDTITFEGTVDGTNYVSLLAQNVATAATATTATANGIYRISVQGLAQVRARVSTYSAGTIYATGLLMCGGSSSTAGGSSVTIGAALPAGTNAIGKLAANSGVDIGDVDVKSIAAGENLIGLVGASDTVVTITPTVAAEAHSAGDLLFDSTEIANAVRVNAGTTIVQSITIVDKGDQKPAIKLLFANAQTDFGAPGGVPDPDDSEALTVIGVVDVPATAYVDLGANSVATIANIGLLVKAGAATTSIYLAGIAVGTPTPASTTDLQIAVGLLRS